ncbi:uncharacterized protein [Ptychodera flava]|uniref:uncharacterized protein n=1 Tax=Ptychodera flava TaxID=63121 RepID=UPI00396A813B
MPTETVKIQDRFYMGQSACVSNFVENINSTSSCNTEGCHGILVPVKSSFLGLGGSMKVDYSCNGCKQRLVSFDSSMYIEGSRWTVVDFPLHIAQFISGHHHSDIFRSLGICLGMNVLAGQTFQNILKLLYPVVRDMVDEVCESAKDEMKALPDDQIGSWKRAITTSDGAWLTRGSFSKNFSFTVRNFCNNSLLYYVHLCQRGNGGIDEPLYPGTSKSAEGYAAERCFQQAKEEEMNVEVNWQDNDSSSIKSFKTVFPGDENKVMFCGGHVTRAHTNQLHKLSAMKSATSAFISRHGKTYPSIANWNALAKKGILQIVAACLISLSARQE